MPTDVNGRRTPVDHRCTDCGRLYGRRIAERSAFTCAWCLGPIEKYQRASERQAS